MLKNHRLMRDDSSQKTTTITLYTYKLRNNIFVYSKIQNKGDFMPMPICCGKEMKITIETGKFIEAECKECGDVVYVKKDSFERPQMIDD